MPDLDLQALVWPARDFNKWFERQLLSNASTADLLLKHYISPAEKTRLTELGEIEAGYNDIAPSPEATIERADIHAKILHRAQFNWNAAKHHLDDAHRTPENRATLETVDAHYFRKLLESREGRKPPRFKGHSGD
jgi:hypothetical protein